jgi:L-ascorbate metabolism protein UlaG (beta-lactamase superfamily)
MWKNVYAGLILLIALAMSGGCTPATALPTVTATIPPEAQAKPTGPLTLQYIGHSCTLITAPDGTRIISDPYKDRPSGLGPFPGELTAEAVTISHFHPDHDNAAAIKGKPKILMAPGTTQVGMVTITGFKGDHGLVDGKSSGENTVFVFQIGGVKIVHLGAAGVVTQSDILAAMEAADVVIVDIMGDAAHPLKDELAQLLERKARTIIPTHYSFAGNLPYYGSVTLDEFLQIVPATLAVVRQGSTLQITANMPVQLVVLAPAANGSQ